MISLTVPKTEGVLVTCDCTKPEGRYDATSDQQYLYSSDKPCQTSEEQCAEVIKLLLCQPTLQYMQIP